MGMNPEIKAQWLAALRSGEYKQGRHTLRVGTSEAQPDQYCCLGVLCDLAQRQGVIPEPVYRDGDWIYGTHDEATWSVLPRSVSEWAGLHNATPDEGIGDVWFGPKGHQKSLSSENDRGLSFTDIAAIIEEHL